GPSRPAVGARRSYRPVESCAAVLASPPRLRPPPGVAVEAPARRDGRSDETRRHHPHQPTTTAARGQKPSSRGNAPEPARSRDQKPLTDGHVVSRRPPLVAGRERGNPARLGRRIDLLSLVVTTYLAEC